MIVFGLFFIVLLVSAALVFAAILMAYWLVSRVLLFLRYRFRFDFDFDFDFILWLLGCSLVDKSGPTEIVSEAFFAPLLILFGR